jgi:hypothetical protein
MRKNSLRHDLGVVQSLALTVLIFEHLAQLHCDEKRAA